MHASRKKSAGIQPDSFRTICKLLQCNWLFSGCVQHSPASLLSALPFLVKHTHSRRPTLRPSPIVRAHHALALRHHCVKNSADFPLQCLIPLPLFRPPQKLSARASNAVRLLLPLPPSTLTHVPLQLHSAIQVLSILEPCFQILRMIRWI